MGQDMRNVYTGEHRLPPTFCEFGSGGFNLIKPIQSFDLSHHPVRLEMPQDVP